MSYPILRFAAIKGSNATSAAHQQIKHDLRMYKVPNADEERKNENIIFTLDQSLVSISDGSDGSQYKFFDKPTEEVERETKATFTKAFKEHVDRDCEKGFVTRSNTVKAIEVMMTASPDVPKDFDWDSWAKDSMKWAEKEFGKDNITLAVLHKDEHTPHIHLQFIPVRDGRLNGSFYLGKSESKKRLHRSYAKEMEKYGLKSREYTTFIKHEDIQNFYARMNDAVKVEVPERERFESEKHYQERLLEWGNNLKMTLFANAEKLANESKENLRAAREYRNEIDNMEVRIRRRSIETNLHEKQYKAMEALQYMVKKDFFDFDELEKMRQAMRQGLKELSKMSEQEKREFWEGKTGETKDVSDFVQETSISHRQDGEEEILFEKDDERD